MLGHHRAFEFQFRLKINVYKDEKVFYFILLRPEKLSVGSCAIMICLTKIFRFEAAHALYGYPGGCSKLHGHSYELHVTVSSGLPGNNYITGQGMIMDFKEIKKRVGEVVAGLDHKLLLSKEYLIQTSGNFSNDELVVMEVEPTAENLLIYLRNEIALGLPHDIVLQKLVLWETRDSYATWSAG